MLKEQLNQTGKLPNLNRLTANGYNDRACSRIAQLLLHFVRLLIEDLDRPLLWAAICTGAVDAGYQAANGRRSRRMKLWRNIEVLTTWLTGELPIFPCFDPTVAVEYNLYYGYNARLPRCANYDPTGHLAKDLGIPELLIGMAHRIPMTQTQLLTSVFEANRLRWLAQPDAEGWPTPMVKPNQTIYITKRVKVETKRVLPEEWRIALQKVINIASRNLRPLRFE